MQTFIISLNKKPGVGVSKAGSAALQFACSFHCGNSTYEFMSTSEVGTKEGKGEKRTSALSFVSLGNKTS